VALWDPLARRKLQGLSSAHRAAVTAVAFSGDGRRLVSGAADGTVSLWDTPTTRLLDSRDVGGRIEAVAFDADGTRVAATSETTGTVVWDAATGKRLHLLPFGSGGDTLTFVDAQTLVVAHGQGGIERWDLGVTPPARTERNLGLGQPLESAYSPDLRLFSGVTLGLERPYLVDVPSGEPLPDPRGPTVAVDAMEFSGDGRILATAGDGRVVLWDTRKREALPEVLAGIPGQPPPVEGPSLALAVSHNGRRVAAAGQRGVAVWDLGAHVLLRELRASGAQRLSNVPNVVRGTSSAAFSPDGRLLAWSILPGTDVGIDFAGRVVVWDLMREREVLRFPSLQVVGFSPDGQRVAGASSSEGPFIIADLRTGEQNEVQTLPWKAEQQGATQPPSERIWSVTSISGLGASIAFDGTVTLWDVERRQALGTVRVPGAFDFSALTFDLKAQRLAVATAGGAMSLVQVTPDVWRTRACTLAARDFTVEERRLHLSGQEVPQACP
jgi:WD40 repeat protein